MKAGARAANWRRPCRSWRLPWAKRFAVIADEAHSSQAGEVEELKELDDGGEVSTEDLLVA